VVEPIGLIGVSALWWRMSNAKRRGIPKTATQLHYSEHRSFAIELAKAWIALAEYEERKELVQIEAAQVVMAGDGTILLIAQSENGQPPLEHLE
jgi:hypothetical protein